jgi:hypothetical protein
LVLNSLDAGRVDRSEVKDIFLLPLLFLAPRLEDILCVEEFSRYV